jgi:hypothetical protein
MELIQAFEDKEVRHLLLGGETDLETAFTQVDIHLRKRFVKGARDRLPGLQPEDLADAWQETLKDLLKLPPPNGSRHKTPSDCHSHKYPTWVSRPRPVPRCRVRLHARAPTISKRTESPPAAEP